MKISKMVIDRQRSYGKVVAAAHTHTPKVQEGFTLLLGPSAGAAAALIVAASASKLDATTATLAAADEAHVAKQYEGLAIRGRRDTETAEVRHLLVEFRELAKPIYGEPYLAFLGYIGDTPTDPTTLTRLAERVLERTDASPAPAVRLEEVRFDLESWKQKLSVSLSRLTGTIQALNTQNREADQTLLAKTEAIEAFDAVFNKTAGLISAMLRVAGEETLADRVKPIRSRPSRLSDPTPEIDPEEPADEIRLA